MFKQVVPLSAETHRALRFSPNQPFDFAAAEILIPVTIGEVDRIARDIPIVFAREGGLPQALLGFEPGRNLYVHHTGQWIGRYIPAHLRRYPFILSELQRTGEDQSATGRRFGIHIDLAAKHLNDQTGARLFDDSGEPTETLKCAQQILTALQQDAERTQLLVAQLESHGLLHEQQLKVAPPGVEAKVLSGFRVVDRPTLAKLSGEVLTGLRDSGALALVYAHLISLTNLQDGWLAKQVAASKAALPTQPDSDASADEPFNFDKIDWSRLGNQ